MTPELVSPLRSRSVRTACLLAVAALLGPAAHTGAQGQLITVHPLGGADFTDLQAAVDAAVAGDVVLLRHHVSVFDTLVIDEPITLIGEGSGKVIGLFFGAGIKSTIRVEDITAGDVVLLNNLTVDGTDDLFTPGSAARMEVVDCEGMVWIERCSVVYTLSFGGSPSLWDGLRVRNSDQVVLVRSTVSANLPGFGYGNYGEGPVGVRAERSSLFVYESTFHGPRAIQNLVVGSKVAGGDGLTLRASTLYAYDSSFYGGQGSAAACQISCIEGGRGGAGVRLSATSEILSIDSEFAGGLGGQACDSGTISCPGGERGSAIAGMHEQATLLSAAGASPVPAAPSFVAGRNYRMAAPAVEGGTTVLWADGEEGDALFNVVGTETTLEYLPLHFGFQLVEPLYVEFEAILGPGTYSRILSLPLLPPQLQFERFFRQGLFVSATGEAFLSSPTVQLVVADE